LKLYIIPLLLRLFARLPLPLCHALGALAGRLLYLCRGRERRVTERNLALCYPQLSDQKRQQLARRSLIETAKWAFEVGAVWFRGARWRQRRIVEFRNLNWFTQAAADKERGLLLLMPHYGNWELAGMWAAEQAPATCIYRTPRRAALDPLVRRARLAAPQSTLVPATARGVLAVLRALKRGEMTIILPDQVPPGEGGVHAEFFGVPAYTQTLVHSLIQKTRPQVLLIYARRIGARFELGFMRPEEGIYSTDAQESARAMNRTIEKLCALDPAQYQWEYKRFKHQADGRDYYE